MQIFPSILTGSTQEAQDQLRTFFDHDLVDTAQIDVVDGNFADNLTITPVDVTQIDTGDLTLDFHIMAEEPMDYVYEIVEHREKLAVRAVIAQIEKMSSIKDYIEEVKKNQIIVGLSLNIFTPIEELNIESLKDVEVVQLMGIEAGFQGQKLNPIVFKKLDELLALREEKDCDFEIIIDGGVKAEHIDKFLAKEVSGFAIGSMLWQSENARTVVENLFGDNT